MRPGRMRVGKLAAPFCALTSILWGPPATTLGQSGGWQMVGQIGGPTTAVAVQGSHAYVGVGLRLVVLDISNPAVLREVGVTQPFPHFVEGVAVSGTWAYVAAGGAGLRVVDISSPTRPTEVGAWDSRGYAEGVAVAGNTVYLADGPYGLRVIDVSNPARPVEVGSAYPLNYAFEVVVAGRYAYIAAAGAGLLIADVSNPARPVEVASLDTPGYAYGVAVAGTTAYVADGWEGLRVVNVANPARPVEVGSYKTPGWAFGIAVSGHLLYIAAASKGLRIADAGNPARPAEIGAYEPRGDFRSVAVAGSTVCVADRDQGLLAIDVADPRRPAGLGLRSFMTHADAVTVVGDLAYVAAGRSGLRVMNISDPTRPREVGVYDVDGAYATSVVVTRGRAYLGAILGRGYGVHIIDVSSPAQPRRMGLFRDEQYHELAVIGDLAYLAGERQFVVLDVSDPAAPARRGAVQLATSFGSFDVRLALNGTRAYVVLHGGEIKVVDISAPSRPALLGTYQPPHPVAGIAVSGGALYMAAGGYGLRIVDLSDVTHPVELGSLSTGGWAEGISLAGPQAYLAVGSGGLRTVDVSKPADPVLLSSYDTPGHAHEVVVVGSTAYIADEAGGLVILKSATTQAHPMPTAAAPGPVANEYSPAGGVPARPITLRPALQTPSAELRHPPRAGATCIVTSPLDSGPGTFRRCLETAQRGDTISFDSAVFPPARPTAIALNSALPRLDRGDLTIDASNAGVILDGRKTPAGTSGLVIESDGNTVRGLQILSFPWVGVAVEGSHNTIGGDRSSSSGRLGQGNLISGNGQSGVVLDGGQKTTTNNIVKGNYIGTTVDGTAAAGNGTHGIHIAGASNNLIANNLISGNGHSGIGISDWGASYNSVVGNLVGTDASGKAILPNARQGIATGAGAGLNRIGGSSPSERNVIAGSRYGVSVGAETLVLGNFIGTDTDGRAPLGNAQGVLVFERAHRAFIGGAGHQEGNVVSGNADGVIVSTDHNFISRNYVGTDAAGTGRVGNQGVGLGLEGGNNIIQMNTVAYNSRGGVTVKSYDSNSLRRNSIHSHPLQPGIKLYEGANRMLSAPMITTVTGTGVYGTTCAACEVEVFSDDEDEGRVFEGSTMADAYGAFALVKGSPLAGPNIRATATDAAGNTSEFSTCILEVWPTAATFPAEGGTGSVSVTASTGCAWVYRSEAPLWVMTGGDRTGSATVFYRILANAAAAPRTGWISIAGQTFTVWQAGTATTGPAIGPAQVVNAASLLPGFASATWITVFGINLAPATRTWRESDFAGNRMPTQLDGVGVNINGKPAYVSYVSPTQINALAPDDPVEGPVQVEVIAPAGKSNAVTVEKRRFAPAFFMFDVEARKYVAAAHADGAYAGKPGLIPGQPSRPAKPGDVVSLYGTGFGPTDPPTPAGQRVSQPAALGTPVAIRIGGSVAEVTYAGLVGPGLYQFNVVVPEVPDGDTAVGAETGGFRSQANAYLTVRR